MSPLLFLCIFLWFINANFPLKLVTNIETTFRGLEVSLGTLLEENCFPIFTSAKDWLFHVVKMFHFCRWEGHWTFHPKATALQRIYFSSYHQRIYGPSKLRDLFSQALCRLILHVICFIPVIVDRVWCLLLVLHILLVYLLEVTRSRLLVSAVFLLIFFNTDRFLLCRVVISQSVMVRSCWNFIDSFAHAACCLFVSSRLLIIFCRILMH